MALGDLLQGALSRGAPTGNSNPLRIPMTFSSRLRLSGNAVIRANAIRFFGTRDYMTTIPMQVNPNSVRWSWPKRITKKDTQEGSAYFHFGNKKNQNRDILTLTFQGSTGNIDLRGSLGDPNEAIRSAFRRDSASPLSLQPGKDTGALLKFLTWHNLLSLINCEPQVLDDGMENQFFINYNSKLFPSSSTLQEGSVDLLLTGHYDVQGLEFTEDATKPNSQNYSFSFVVGSAFPEIDNILGVITNMFVAQGTPTTLPATAGPFAITTTDIA